MSAKHTVAVKELAAFVHRRGDLHYRYQSATLAEEGIARQQAWQRGRGESYRREVRVAATFGALAVSGRVDGWDAPAGVVEEVKTTRADAPTLHTQAGQENMAQARLYGGLLVLCGEAPAGLATLRLRLVYLHPTQPGETVFTEAWTAADLVTYFEVTCGCYLAWLGSVQARLAARDRRLRALKFPFAAFRGEQRLMAKHVYRGFRDAKHSLVEAPTGAGKTMASVFPALKAMGEGQLDRLVFLTARGTGQAAAEAALRQAADGAVAVIVAAKARICFNPELPCDPASCAYARGYYERQPAARRELLAAGVVAPAQVAAVARRHRVCPFELSLDAAAWADVVVGDYNYVLDPVVRLKRLDNPLFARVGLVVDEAHQLGERVQAMLGARLPRAALRTALESATLPAPLARAFRSVDRALGRLPRQPGERWEVPPPEALCRAVTRANKALATSAALQPEQKAATDAGWLLLRFERAVEAAAPDGFHYLASGRGKRRVLELVCTVPTAHIQATLQGFHGSVRLSGTLTPAAMFQRLHGFACEAPVLAIGAGASRLGVFAVADVSTYYRDRQRSLDALVTLIRAVRQATPGNCLVAFPSFDYLEAAAERLRPDDDVACQQRDMDATARAAFVERLAAPGRRHAGLVVMGGLFAESVDFDSRALRSIVVVGPGLPPRSLERDLIAADNAEAAGDGQALAYLQPAMTRVAQAVGRVARGGAAGTAVLVDPRFASRRYQAHLPGHWRLRRTRAAEVGAQLSAFWQNVQRSPPSTAI